MFGLSTLKLYALLVALGAMLLASGWTWHRYRVAAFERALITRLNAEIAAAQGARSETANTAARAVFQCYLKGGSWDRSKHSCSLPPVSP
ncbi:MAG: hypothetical protein NW206_18535 [Hyphomonadaceae bacterium]|nr:hypothetical protein [Hyphomonadaceae bacterium]